MYRHVTENLGGQVSAKKKGTGKLAVPISWKAFNDVSFITWLEKILAYNHSCQNNMYP